MDEFLLPHLRSFQLDTVEGINVHDIIRFTLEIPTSIPLSRLNVVPPSMFETLWNAYLEDHPQLDSDTVTVGTGKEWYLFLQPFQDLAYEYLSRITNDFHHSRHLGDTNSMWSLWNGAFDHAITDFLRSRGVSGSILHKHQGRGSPNIVQFVPLTVSVSLNLMTMRPGHFVVFLPGLVVYTSRSRVYNPGLPDLGSHLHPLVLSPRPSIFLPGTLMSPTPSLLTWT